MPIFVRRSTLPTGRDRRPRPRVWASSALTALALAGSGLALPATAGAAPANDSFDQFIWLHFGETRRASTDGATTETSESFTAKGIGELAYCRALSGAQSQMDKTVWWRTVGSGRPVTVTTAGSTEDTVLGAFRSKFTSVVTCNDNAGTGAHSELTFDTVAGHSYYLQVGRCSQIAGATSPRPCADRPGSEVRIRADTPAPANDARSAAQAVASGESVKGDNYGSNEEPGEPLTCAPAGDVPYGRTVWYRWTAPTAGHARFVSASNVSGVVAVWSGGQALGCAASEGAGPAAVDVAVGPGEYFVQVAGRGRRNLAVFNDSETGSHDFHVDFIANPDRDGDGIANDVDCAADDPVRGGADKPRDGIDQDCDGRDADPDRDRDGVPNELDCAADDAARYPGAVDKPRDGIDQDCDGQDAPLPHIGTPMPAMSFVGGSPTLTLRGLPPGGRVTIRCTKCSRRVLRRSVGQRKTSLVLRRAALGRWRAGAVIKVDVTAPGWIGHRWTWRVRDGAPRRSVECRLPEGGAKPRC